MYYLEEKTLARHSPLCIVSSASVCLQIQSVYQLKSFNELDLDTESFMLNIRIICYQENHYICKEFSFYAFCLL